mmetsp:Transcript_42755/g.41107  ORF Transcript_42755/g.41107 Transcript_42755/m.41107 type:complete len:105 (-) Transcript_42755:753-1067(-)
MLDNGLAAVFDSAGEDIEEGMNSLVIGNAVLNIFLSSSLSFLWGMINALQIIVNIPLFTISFPANAKMFYSFIVGIATFDVIPMEAIQEKFFSFTETEAKNQQF